MKLLQRYIFSELLRVFSLLVIVLTVMLVFVGLFREATERGLGAVQILQIMPFVVPSMLPFTIPATLLLSVIASMMVPNDSFLMKCWKQVTCSSS